MRRNPLLMTVMSGNPCRSNPSYQANPFVLIDSATNKIIRTWRGSMMDRKPWDWATDAARRLGRPVFVVAHPYVPPTFRAGVEVSPLFYFGGPFQEVHPDGSRSAGPAGGYKRNPPGFFPSMAGGIAGSLIANALSNPRRPSEPDEHAARELELYVTNDADLYRQRFIPIVKNLMKRRAKGDYDHEKAAKLFLYLVDDGARKYYKEFGTERGGFKFDLATRWAVAKSLRDSFETEAELGNYDNMTFGVSNPLTRSESARQLRQARYAITRARESRGSHRHLEAGEAIGRAAVVEGDGPASARGAAQNMIRRAMRTSLGMKRNPGPVSRRRKVTMTLEAFAKYIKSKNDPKLWKDFIKKIKGYQKWTHGTLPKRVTIEVVDKPGVSGLWMTYDAGTVPESAYVMPKGSKRKGAWKHPWETGQPKIKHDPEAGIVMHKLTGQNRISDFYHK